MAFQQIMSVRKYLLTGILLLLSSVVFSQDDQWDWWNELHGWEQGMPSWKRWLIISPGYLGPNALPVPDIKAGYIPEMSEVSISGSRHFHPGDPTQDISGRLFLPFADSRIAFEVYGVILENYAFSEEIRNERFARDKDGRGITQGDLYFSTLIQVVRDRMFPDMLFRIAGRTASGGAYSAARYSDSPGYFFDVSLSKDIGAGRWSAVRPFASAGFYSWQTNDEYNLQNDAFFYGAGLEFKSPEWLISGVYSGYSGYQRNRDKPSVLTFNLRHDWDYSAMALAMMVGLRHWDYYTIKITYAWKFDGL